MEALKIKLYRRAVIKHGMNIKPCNNHTFSECFTTYKNTIHFWYNDDTGNTYTLSEVIG